MVVIRLIHRGSRMIRDIPLSISQTGLALSSQVTRSANETRKATATQPLGGKLSRRAARNAGLT